MTAVALTQSPDLKSILAIRLLVASRCDAKPATSAFLLVR